jgi:hypothetical protein
LGRSPGPHARADQERVVNHMMSTLPAPRIGLEAMQEVNSEIGL